MTAYTRMVVSRGLASTHETRNQEQLASGPRSHGSDVWAYRTFVGNAGEPDPARATDGCGSGPYVATGARVDVAEEVGLAVGPSDGLGSGATGVEIIDWAGPLRPGDATTEEAGVLA